MKKMLQKIQGDVGDDFRQSVKKVELPQFDGEDLAGWIVRAEIYFRVQGTHPERRVELAQLCMEGHTIHFFKALMDDDEHLTWEKLKAALLERYGGIGEGSVFEQLSALTQEAGVDEYIQAFEGLVSQVPKMSDEQYMGYFIHGLQEGIKGRVRSLKTLGPVSRPRLMNLARAVELELQEKRPNGSGSRGSGNWHHSRVSGTAGSRSQTSGKGQGNDWVLVRGAKEGADKNGPVMGPKSGFRSEKKSFGPRDRGIRHLSYQQLMERREKGLCFKCGGPFHSRHQCPDRHLRIMMIEEEELGDGEVNAMYAEEEEEVEEGELSVMSLKGLVAAKSSDLRTRKIRGQVQGVPILLLIDSGATHNFIS